MTGMPNDFDALAAGRIGFAEEDLAGAGSVGGHDRKRPDWAATSDQDRAARLKPAAVDCCHRDSRRLHHRSLFKSQGVRHFDGRGCLHDREIREPSPIPCQASRGPASAKEMQAADAEITIGRAHMGLDRYAVSQLQVGHVAPNGHDFTAELVAENSAELRPPRKGWAEKI